MIIQHNMTAMNNRRQMGIVEGGLAKTTEKLSSGYRINRAADDAAGLSISEKMRGQIRGLKRASMNAADGISLIQTAEGGMNEIHSILQRMGELSVQAANDTNVESDRRATQLEIDALIKEIDRIADETEFNTIKLLDGHVANPNALMGVSGGTLQTVSGTVHLLYTDVVNDTVSFDVTVTPTPGSQATTIPSQLTNAQGQWLKDELKNTFVPQAVKSILDKFPDTFGYLDGSNLGIGLSLNYDTHSTTLASVSMGLSGVGTSQNGTMVYDVDLSYNLNVNCASLTFDTNGELTPASRDALEVTIVHEMTHALMDEALTNGMAGRDEQFRSTGGFPLWFVEGMAQASAGGGFSGNDWVANGLHINAGSSQADIQSALRSHALSNSQDDTANYGTGYLAVMYLGYLANGGLSSTPPAAPTAAGIASGLDHILLALRGDKVINNTSTNNGISLDQAIANYTGGKYTSQSGFERVFANDPDAAQFIKDLTDSMQNGAGGLVMNFFSDYRNPSDQTTDYYLPNNSTASTVFHLDTDHVTVINDYPSGYQVLSGGSGHGNSGTNGSAGNGLGLILQVGANAGQIIRLYIASMSSDSIGVAGVNVTTQASAERAISAVHDAIQVVSFHRVSLGAYQNRLEHTVANADNMAENLEASESKIRDTDMAKEMVRYSTAQILLQAGQSMLAQTNQMTQGVLQLLS